MKRTVFRWGRAGWQQVESYLPLSGETQSPDMAGDDGGGQVLSLSDPLSGLRDQGSRVFDIDRRFYS